MSFGGGVGNVCPRPRVLVAACARAMGHHTMVDDLGGEEQNAQLSFLCSRRWILVLPKKKTVTKLFGNAFSFFLKFNRRCFDDDQ